MTTDGINVYCGTASTSIYVVDPITKTLTSTISITTTSNATARFLLMIQVLLEQQAH